MTKKLLISSLLLVYGTDALSTFFEKGQRAELFEIMDDEIPIFRVTVPEENFIELKEQAQSSGMFGNWGNFTFGDWGNFTFGDWGNWNNTEGGFGGFGGFGNWGGFGAGADANAVGNVDNTGAVDAGAAGGNMGGFNMGNFGGFGGAAATGADAGAAEGNMGGFNMGNFGGFGGAAATGADNGAAGGNMGGFNMGNFGGFGGAAGAEAGANVGAGADGAGAGAAAGGFGGWDFGNWGGFNNTDGGFGDGSFNVFGDPYKIKDASMVVEINGTKKTFKKVTFTLGGSSSRIYGRQAFNLKIRGGKELYGRSQFRLRSDAREATYLRSKLTCDMHNRLGLNSISANYMELYVNDEYLGMYVIMDAPKVSWAELAFDDENTNNLYKCKSGNNLLTLDTNGTGCENENEESTDNSEWIEFLTALDKANSAEDIEDIFDVDQFLYEMAFEYLSGSWDHFLNTGHNYSMYKNPKTGKWQMIEYDFDGEIGQDVSSISMSMGFNTQTAVDKSKDYTVYTFAEWANKPRHILDILIFNDTTRFDNILKKFVTEVFNPATLFPRIDELKEFIKPHVIRDKTPEKWKMPRYS